MPRCFARMEKALSETEVNHGVPCDAMWCHVMPCDAMWCHVMPCDAMWCYVMPFDAMWYHVMPQNNDQKEFWANFHNLLKVREDDVWIASFPKCGTTWTQVSSKENYSRWSWSIEKMMMLFVQEMVWNIMHDVDLETAKATTLEKRVSRKLQEFQFFQVFLPGIPRI